MKTALLLDENRNTLKKLEESIHKGCPEIDIIGSCSSAIQGREQILQFQPDIVFLDMELSQLNGFELLSSLPHIDFAIIFMGSFEYSASKIFEYDAVDYLVKPIPINRLREAIERAIRLSAYNASVKFNSVPSITPSMPISTIPIPTHYGYEFQRVDQIMYVEADSNYSIIYFMDGRKVCVPQTLKRLEQMFRNHSFIRIHQSYLVNLEHIQKYYKGGGGYVVMRNGQDLTVSRRSKERVMNVIRHMQGSALHAKVG